MGEVAVGMDVCQPCIYFRGASLVTGREGWNIVCNWPRNGSEIAGTVPAAFREAFSADAE